MARCVSSNSVAQSLEPFSTLVEAIAFGGHRRLSPLELGLPFLAQLNPGIALAREFLFATGQVGFAPLLLIGLERMFPFQRLFTFFDQRPHVRQLLETQPAGGLPCFEIGPIGLVLAPQLVLRRLDFLTGFLQMLLLEAETVLEQVALLLEAAQLLAVLLFELPLLFAQVLLAGVDALLQIVFDAGTHAIQFASGRLDLIPYGGPLALDLLELNSLELGQFVGEPPSISLELLAVGCQRLAGGQVLSFEGFAFAAELVEFPTSHRVHFFLGALGSRLRDFAPFGEFLVLQASSSLPGRLFRFERGSLGRGLRVELCSLRISLIGQLGLQRADHLLPLAAAFFDFFRQGTAFFVESLLGLLDGNPLDLELAVDHRPQARSLRRHLIAETQDEPLLLFQITDERLAVPIFSLRASSRALHSACRLSISSSNSCTHIRAVRHSWSKSACCSCKADSRRSRSCRSVRR